MSENKEMPEQQNDQQEDSQDQSEAMKLMIKRKGLMRKLREIDRHKDPDAFFKMNQETSDLLKQANKLGGLSTEEAYVLALGY